eukprot:866623-Prorocentrum_minimum.AAC.1
MASVMMDTSITAPVRAKNTVTATYCLVSSSGSISAVPSSGTTFTSFSEYELGSLAVDIELHQVGEAPASPASPLVASLRPCHLRARRS